VPSVRTSDGVALHYDEAGSGPPILLIPGWSQTAAQFGAQLEGLQDRYRLIALDHRGHGESEKPEHGYRIARLAKDVRDVLEALDLDEVTLLGHSMGCSVIWSYLDTFGPERVSRLVLVDQMPCIMANPVWAEEERLAAGPILDHESLYPTINGLASQGGAEVTRQFVGGMFTDAYDRARVDWAIEQNLKLPRRHAATLLYNHATQDWRDVIRRIELPTLVIGGRKSLIDWRSQVWIQSVIAGSKLEIFEEDEGGNHFMFMENPTKFNRLVAEFVG
jgi:pimeloyl-ACP methyl ester carboxylesterase